MSSDRWKKRPAARVKTVRQSVAAGRKKANDFEDALRLENEVRYGLASSIYTSDLAKRSGLSQKAKWASAT